MALSDTALVVRYYCDEAASGTSPSAILDGSGVGSDFDLTIDYQSSKAAYTEVSGNRGLEITDQASTAPVANKAISASDKVDDLGGLTQMTMELVVNVKVGLSSVGRVFGITGNVDEGAFMVAHDGATDGSEGYVRWLEADRVFFGWTLNERAVWHFVIDTTQAANEDRIKIYKNGSLIADTEGVTVTQNSTLDIQASSFLCMGNRANDGNRAVEAIFYYAALYSEAFSATRASDHYDVLTADDDTPAVGGNAPTGGIYGPLVGPLGGPI